MNHAIQTGGTLSLNSSKAPLQGRVATLIASLICLAVFGGCASTKVSDRQTSLSANEKLPRPGQILVYDFATTAADVPASSTMAREFTIDSTPQTAEQVATGREVGGRIAAELVEQIRGMGMPAKQAVKGTTAQVNDIVIHGYLVSINEGSAAKRVAIGFGSGATELRTVVEGFQMTAQGLRKLGSGTLDSSGGKTPGAAVGAATFIATANPAGLIVSTGMKVYGEASGSSKMEGRARQTAKEIADVLQKRFREQGWIN